MAAARELGAGVWALRLPLAYPVVKSVNAYLLEAEGGHVLVDCGSSLGDGWDHLVDALAAAGAAPEDLAVLLCTHSHADHCGLAAEVVERTGCRLVMGAGPHPVIDVLRDPTIPFADRRALHRRHGTPEAEIAELASDINEDGLHPRAEPELAPASLTTGSGAWQLLPAPGHSADQVMLWHPERRWLIGADLAIKDARPFVEHGTSADPHADYLASLDRALALEPELLLAGHGRPITTPAEVLARARASVRDGAERMGAALDARPRTGYELGALLCPPDASRPSRQRAFAEALSALEHLKARGLARSCLDGDGVLRWLAFS
jgi:glyoxylase-like metal-dependent hydrolase (beta-lactamase superfamily II)